MSKEMREQIDNFRQWNEKQLNENINYSDKLKTLETEYKKEFNKYYKAMNYRIMSFEVEALYNVLVLNKESDDKLTSKHEANVREILER